MRIVAAVLFAILVLLQYRLWLGDGGMREVWRLRGQIAAQEAQNQELRERNRMLAAEVQDLKEGTTAIEERARTDLGMIARGETYYQVVVPKQAAVQPPAAEDRDDPGEAPDRDRRGEWQTAQSEVR